MHDVANEHEAIVKHVLKRNADMAVKELIIHYTRIGGFWRNT